MRIFTGALVALTMAAPGVALAGPTGNGQGWGGFYIGGHVGGTRAQYEGVYDNADTTPTDIIDFDQLDDWGFSGGGQIGYDFQAPGMGGIVIGVVGDGSWLSNDDHAIGLPDGNEAAASIDWIASARVRAGYPVADFMPYFTVGAAFTDIDAYVMDDGGPKYDVGGSETGYVVGGGVEWAATEHVSIGLEMLYYQFDADVDLFDAGVSDADPGDFFEFDSMLTVRMTANYRF